MTDAAERDKITEKGGVKLEQAKKRDHKIVITDVAVDKVPYVVIPGWTVEQNVFLRQVNQDILRIAMKENNSDEVACVYNRYTLERTPAILGDTISVDIDNNIDVMGLQNKSYAFELVLSHNHPSTSNFSFADIDYFIANDYLGLMTVVTNQGEVYALRKTDTYDYDKIQSVKTKLISDYSLENQAEMAKEFLKRCREGGVEYVKGK